MAYSADADLLLGDVPISATFDKTKFVNDAADEIDSIIGLVYETPVAMSSPTSRPAQLLLKRLNNFLATGRLILAMDAGGEDTQLHAYGRSLVREATTALEMIRNGQIDLVGAERLEGTSASTGGPRTINADSASAVDAFYDRVMRPESGLPGPLPYRDWAPGDDPTGKAAYPWR